MVQMRTAFFVLTYLCKLLDLSRQEFISHSNMSRSFFMCLHQELRIHHKALFIPKCVPEKVGIHNIPIRNNGISRG
jgi:hypothetical protein